MLRTRIAAATLPEAHTTPGVAYYQIIRLHNTDAPELIYAGADPALARATWEATKIGPQRGTVRFLHNGMVRGVIGK